MDNSIPPSSPPKRGRSPWWPDDVDLGDTTLKQLMPKRWQIVLRVLLAYFIRRGRY